MQYETEDTIEEKPRNKDLVESIEEIKAAFLEAFWIGKKEDIPGGDPRWCEIWLRTNQVKIRFCRLGGNLIYC